MFKSRLRALAVVPLAGVVLLLGACSGDGEDRPAVDVITGSPGAGGATTGSVSASGADVAGPQPTQIPGAVETVTRERYVPPCFGERSVPVYEITKEPLYGCRMVPRWGAIQREVPAMRQEAVFETRRTPVCVQASVPVYATRCTPVMAIDLTSWCQERVKPSYHIVEQVQCGVRTEPRIVGYKEEKVQVGTVNVPL